MLNVDALKLLYVELGGDADDVADITLLPDMIAAIAGIIKTALASVLPAVTAEDAGKVLKVSNAGKWEPGTDATE